jgi:hypothetical protein
MSFEPREYLRPILVEVDHLREHSATLSFEAFRADETEVLVGLALDHRHFRAWSGLCAPEAPHDAE